MDKTGKEGTNLIGKLGVEKQQKDELDAVRNAYQKEMNMFMHVHMRGYDKYGQGVFAVCLLSFILLD